VVKVKEGEVAKILVIDDDAGMRRTVGRILRGAGHEVAEAQDGLEGIELFRADEPDIVVTDIFMPKKEGIETILDLRREHPSTLILAISGGATAPGSTGGSSFLDLAQGLGADGTLAKPFRAEDLLREIDKLLQGRIPGA
jgi:CheY-like chemotaxis protein